MQITHDENGLLTKSEEAELLKVSGRTIDNWCYRGILPYSKIGDANNAIVRIRRADRFLSSWIPSALLDRQGRDYVEFSPKGELVC